MPGNRSALGLQKPNKMKHNSLFKSKEQILFPSMVIWADDFRLEDDPYLVSFKPDETKSRLAKEFLGVEITEEQEKVDLLITSSRDGHSFIIATWDVFLAFAKPKHVREIKRAVSQSNALARYAAKQNS